MDVNDVMTIGMFIFTPAGIFGLVIMLRKDRREDTKSDGDIRRAQNEEITGYYQETRDLRADLRTITFEMRTIQAELIETRAELERVSKHAQESDEHTSEGLTYIKVLLKWIEEGAVPPPPLEVQRLKEKVLKYEPDGPRAPHKRTKPPTSAGGSSMPQEDT